MDEPEPVEQVSVEAILIEPKRINCPTCGKRYDIPPKHVGKKFRCIKCKTKVRTKDKTKKRRKTRHLSSRPLPTVAPPPPINHDPPMAAPFSSAPFGFRVMRSAVSKEPWTLEKDADNLRIFVKFILGFVAVLVLVGGVLLWVYISGQTSIMRVLFPNQEL